MESRIQKAAGLREFGENYIQEFAEKRPALDDLAGAKYHFIGHLQSNKARLACQLFDIVQTADSARLLARLDAAAAERGSHLEVMLEVKLWDEASKSGARPEEVPALLEAASRCRHLAVSGLMTMLIGRSRLPLQELEGRNEHSRATREIRLTLIDSPRVSLTTRRLTLGHFPGAVAFARNDGRRRKTKA